MTINKMDFTINKMDLTINKIEMNINKMDLPISHLQILYRSYSGDEGIMDQSQCKVHLE